MANRDKWLPKIVPFVAFLIIILTQVEETSLLGMIVVIIFPLLIIALMVWLIICILEDIPFYYKLNSSVRKVIKSNIIFASIIFMFSFLNSESIRNYIQDIPQLYNKNYETVEGDATMVFNHEGGGLRTSIKYTDFTIDDTRFSIERELFIPVLEDGFYSVKYLSHSKMVIEISKAASSSK